MMCACGGFMVKVDEHSISSDIMRCTKCQGLELASNSEKNC